MMLPVIVNVLFFFGGGGGGAVLRLDNRQKSFLYQYIISKVLSLRNLFLTHSCL